MKPPPALGRVLAMAALLLATAPADASLPTASPQPSEEEPADQGSEPEEDETGEAEDDAALIFAADIVVTATRFESPVKKVGSSVTVIGRQEIQERNEPSVLELLRTVPGLEVSQSGGPGALTSVYMRGANSNHTLVLIDGVRSNDANVGNFDFAHLNTDNVERIEILRGPQSTLYGTEAIGGVISIRTLKGRPGFHLTADGRLGSHATRELRLAFDGARSRFDYSAAVATRETDGVSAASEERGNTERDPTSGISAASRLGLDLSGEGRLDLTLRVSDDESSLDGFSPGLGPTDDPNFRLSRTFSVASLEFRQPLTERLALQVTAGASNDEKIGEDPDTPFNNFELESRLQRLGGQLDFDLGAQNRLLVGYSHERRDGVSAGAYDESFSVTSWYLQNSWERRERLFLTAGLRHDRYSDFGDETTYRMTGAYLWPGSGLRIHGSAGTGFRGPSLTELFFPFSGNPDLEPETSRGLDLGLEAQLGGGSTVAGLTYFRNRFSDLIEFDFGTSTFGNILEATTEGVEATVRSVAGEAVELSASYTYLSTENRVTGGPLARRPRHRITLLTAFRAGSRLRGTAAWVRVAERIDSDGTEMDDYGRLDLGFTYRLKPWLHPYVKVDNLLDAEYEEVNGFTSPGLTAVAGLRFRRP